MPSDDASVRFSTGAESPETPGRRPYSIVFVGDLGAPERLAKLTPVDKDSFAALLADVRPTLALAVEDPLADGQEWEFQLAFDSIKSFEPAAFLAHVPNARWRLGVREKLLARQQAAISADELDDALSAAAAADRSLSYLTQPTAASGAAGGAGVAPPSSGSILDMVEEPTEGARIAADIERLAAAAGDAAARLPAAEAARIGKLLERVERELGLIAAAVLKHNDVRRLEMAWRGLKFLVDRVDFREGVRLAVLHAPRDAFVERVIEHVINPAFNGDIPTPGLIVCDYLFANSAADIETLDRLARHAASLPAPAVVSLSAQFFNLKSLRLIKNLPSLPGMIDGWEYAKWRGLRDQPYAKSLAAVVGRFILRPPYEARPRARDFSFPESVQSIGDLVWGGGHLAVAVCAARAYARHGWPTRMWGAEAGKIEDLPLVPNPADPQNPWGPGELTLPDRRVDELPAIGVNLLQSIPNKDYCMLLGGVTAARPIKTAETSSQQAALEISMPYQQFSNIASAFLCEQLPALRGLEPQQIQQRLLAGLAELLQLKDEEDKEAVQVGVGHNPQAPGQTIVQVRLSPPARVAPGGLHVDFNFSV